MWSHSLDRFLWWMLSVFSATMIIIYAHGNGCDIGSMYEELLEYRNAWKVCYSSYFLKNFNIQCFFFCEGSYSRVWISRVWMRSWVSKWGLHQSECKKNFWICDARGEAKKKLIIIVVMFLFSAPLSSWKCHLVWKIHWNRSHCSISSRIAKEECVTWRSHTPECLQERQGNCQGFAQQNGFQFDCK